MRDRHPLSQQLEFFGANCKKNTTSKAKGVHTLSILSKRQKRTLFSSICSVFIYENSFCRKVLLNVASENNTYI